MKRFVQVTFFADSLNIGYHQKIHEADEVESIKAVAEKIHAEHFAEQFYPAAIINLQVLDLINVVSKTSFFKLEFSGAESVIPLEKVIEIFEQLFHNFAATNVFTEYANQGRVYYLEFIPLAFDTTGSKLLIDLKEAIRQQNHLVKQTALAFYFEKELTRYIYEINQLAEQHFDDLTEDLSPFLRGEKKHLEIDKESESELFEKVALENYHLKLEIATLRDTIIAYHATDAQEDKTNDFTKLATIDYQMILRAALLLKPAWQYYLKLSRELSIDVSADGLKELLSHSVARDKLKHGSEKIEIDLLQTEVEWIDARTKLLKRVNRQIVAVKILTSDLERLKQIGVYAMKIQNENKKLKTMLEVL
ncbi:MAG: hypothetical protein LBS33_00435 [Streptococcaceae bacterium]|nr:hypothetical protein [Streptococcaceae bacterium]